LKTKHASVPRLRGDGQTKTTAVLCRLMDEFVVPYSHDLVLYVQFLALQLRDFQVVRRWVGECFANFGFECLVPSFEFREMRFNRHVACLLARQIFGFIRSTYASPTSQIIRLFGAAENPLCALFPYAKVSCGLVGR
jgi:hypothetical protein